MRFSRIQKLNFFLLSERIQSERISTVCFHNQKLEWPVEKQIDLSEAQDGSIMAGVEDFYTLEISTQDENVGILAPESCEDFFYGGEKIVNIDFDNFYAFETESMSGMFRYLPRLSYVSFYNRIESRRLCNVDEMFLGCINLREIHGFRNVDLTHVKDARKMFAWCENVEKLDFTKHRMPNCELMTYMCYGCTGLRKFNIFRDDTLKLLDAAEMFNKCEDLKINVISGGTTKKTGVYGFYDYISMEPEGIYNEAIPPRTRELIFGEFSTEKTEYDVYATEHTSVFGKIWHRNEEKLEKVTRIIFEEGEVPKGVQPLDYSLEEDGTILGWIENKTTLHICAVGDRVILAPQVCSNMFAKCYNVEIIELYNFETSHVLSFALMFQYLDKLKSVIIPEFRADSATNMAGMFEGCRNLKEIIGLQILDTTRVINYSRMFKYCESLESIDLSGFEYNFFSNVKEMIYGCVSLRDLNLSRWKMKFFLPDGYADFVAYCPNLRQESIIWEQKDFLSVDEWNVLFGNLSYEPPEDYTFLELKKQRAAKSLRRLKNKGHNGKITKR